MRSGYCGTVVAVTMLAACHPSQPQRTAAEANVAAPAAPAPSAPPPPAAPPTRESPPAPPAPPPPPAPPSPEAAGSSSNTADAADPKSAEAALDIARDFAALVSARKFDRAFAVAGPRSGFASVADLKRHFAPYAELSLTVEDTPPPQPEGAAGSIYLSVHATISGVVDGRRVNHPATITLRRVNDVPGSTEAQRRWHIERFDDSVM